MSETQKTYIVKINSALSNKPLFVSISDPKMSVDRIFTEAINSLRNSGKPLQSKELASIYKNHSLFNGHQLIKKGSLFNELANTEQILKNKTIKIAELNLVTSHSGG